MPGSNAGSGVSLGSLEASGTARIQQWHEHFAGEYLLFGDDVGLVVLSVEARLSGLWVARFRRPRIGEPLLKAAVEDRDLLRAEMAEHEPSARRGSGWRIIIADDAIVAGDSDLLRRRAERLAREQHVRRGVRPVAELVDVEEAGARDVSGAIFRAAAA